MRRGADPGPCERRVDEPLRPRDEGRAPGPAVAQHPQGALPVDGPRRVEVDPRAAGGGEMRAIELFTFYMGKLFEFTKACQRGKTEEVAKPFVARSEMSCDKSASRKPSAGEFCRIGEFLSDGKVERRLCLIEKMA